MNARFLPVVIFSLFSGSAIAQTAPEPVTRAVWVQQLSGDPDPYAGGNVFRLMARELPSPPRVLLPGPGNFSRPLLSSDGNTVFYTDRHAVPGESGTAYSPEIFAVSFAGGEPRKLGPGMAVAVWQGTDGTEFIYALTSLQSSRRPALTGEILVRFQAAKPDEREIMWSETPLGADNFQLSHDGSRAAGLFPWPQTGLADLNARTFTPLAQGSFPSLASDNSYALAVLDGDRRRLRVFVPNVDPGWDLLPAQALPQQAGEINHPRWSNDALAITFSGPPAGGDAPDVYLAKLRPDLRAIQQAVPLSSDPAPDYFPDVWISGGYDHKTTLPQQPAVVSTPLTAPWPVSQDDLHFSWENAAAPGAVDVFKLHGYATPGRLGSLNVSAGWADVSPGATKRLSEACAASGSFTMEALVSEWRTPEPCSLRLLSLQTPENRDAFALYRVNRSLVLRILTGGGEGRPPVVERHTLTPLSVTENAPFSLFLTVHGGKLQVYLDGKPLKEITFDQPGLQAWKDLHLMAGDPQPYGTPWTGQIERIACYSRALAAAEVADAWRATEAMLIKRKQPTRCKIKARLLERPPLPNAATLAASPRWLNASAWEIEQVLTGYLKPGKITILQWAWLDGKPAPLPDIKNGQSMELSVESFDDHPEIQSVKSHNALKTGEQPVFLDVTPPGRHLKPFPQ
ncbi:MAG TPA: LamG-like jellyroll fold domain-containing protein [Verrucomicrobiales bacterium]|nr:LamG-like jellyroll fold domain-containing protein [Verrucomicrobiales bacterium]